MSVAENNRFFMRQEEKRCLIRLFVCVFLERSAMQPCDRHVVEMSDVPTAVDPLSTNNRYQKCLL
jgi:hypothetical protein